MRAGWLLVVVALGAFTQAASAAEEQFFASIYLGGDKIGQAQVRQRRGEGGEIEELRARASVSILGINLYEFTHDTSQRWTGGRLQSLTGRADDNGEIDVVSVERSADGYAATLNGKALTLPADAFPNSLWHYGIVRRTLLFNVINLRLMRVSVATETETITLNGKSVPAERVTIGGDYQATVWFDDDHNFLQARYRMNDRPIEIRIDP